MTGHQPSRRSFLAASTALAAGALRTAAGGAIDPDRKVRVAVVGTGARGSELIRNLTTIQPVDLAAVCDDYDPHLAKAKQYAGPQAQAFSDYRKMLTEVRPDAVVIAVPLHLHFELAMQALDAGCAVFCEKTMCYSIEQAAELALEVKKRQAIFQVGLQRRANAIYQQAQAMAETGMLGRISTIKAQWHRHNDWRRPVPVKADDSRWSELERKLNWRLYREFSRGLLTELASHQMDVANWLLGTHPSRVIGVGGIDYWRDGREVYDNIFCTWEYELPLPAGQPEQVSAGEAKTYTVRVTYSSIQNNAYEGASELVEGTKGTLFLTQRKGLFYREGEAANPGWTKDGRVERDAAIITSGKTLKLSNDPWAHRGKPYEMDIQSSDTRDELVAFIDNVQRKDPQTVCTAEHGFLDSATVLIADEAMRERKTVAFPTELYERVRGLR